MASIDHFCISGLVFSFYITLTNTVGSLQEGEPNADRVNIYKPLGARYKCNLDNQNFWALRAPRPNAVASVASV